VLQVALYSGLVGGVLAILIALRYGQLQPMLLNLYRGAVGLFIQINHGVSAAPWVMVTRSYPLPYALAIALGTLVYAFLHVFL
jgi:Flp pilus assembly protein protease CpaA